MFSFNWVKNNSIKAWGRFIVIVTIITPASGFHWTNPWIIPRHQNLFFHGSEFFNSTSLRLYTYKSISRRTFILFSINISKTHKNLRLIKIERAFDKNHPITSHFQSLNESPLLVSAATTWMRRSNENVFAQQNEENATSKRSCESLNRNIMYNSKNGWAHVWTPCEMASFWDALHKLRTP